MIALAVAVLAVGSIVLGVFLLRVDRRPFRALEKWNRPLAEMVARDTKSSGYTGIVFGVVLLVIGLSKR